MQQIKNKKSWKNCKKNKKKFEFELKKYKFYQ